MQNRNARARSRRSRRNRHAGLGGLIALGVAGPILGLSYFLVSPGPAGTAATADVQSTPASYGTGSGGWGRGGYPMMNGSGSGGGLAPAAQAPENAGASPTQVASANWAGYAAAGSAGEFTSVSSSWSEPAVTCDGADTFSSFWVGLDGDGTPTVEQTGTEADCDGGTASYQGWYEVFPDPPVFFTNPVRPGDALSASVTSDGGGTFTLVLADSTQGWTQSTQQAVPGAQLGSAEIITEAPSSSTTVLPLADFGTVNFTAATVNHDPLGASPGLSELTMSSAGEGVLAAPSALSDGTAFTVTAQAGTAQAGTSQTGSAAASPAGRGSMGGGGGASDGGGRRHHHHVWGG